jgi:VWFA-related protein
MTSKPGEVAQQADKDFKIKVDTTLIQVPVSVLDKTGRPVDNLKEENFAVFEDRIPQKIKLFHHEDVPISIGLVIDNSGSMRNKRERVNSAALAFVRESNPEDETFIVNFDDSPYLDQDFTGSIGDLMDALDNIDTRGETALYDAIGLSLEHVVKDGHRDSKALLVISDGEDNKSKFKFEEVLKQLKESKVTVYAIGLLEENEEHGLFQAPPSKKAKQKLQQFAEATGGVAYFPKTLDEVEELCKQIAHDLRNRYTLAYTPSNLRPDGSWREIKVVVNAPKPIAAKMGVPRHKPGYFAPNPPSQ